MGIPKFFRWISERYPMCSQLITDKAIPEFDNLYLDMNGIIHNCSHNNNTNAHFRITEEQIWLQVFNYVDHLFSKIKPKKFFFMAVDGVAPRAKMNQQRSRRFRTAKDAEEERKKALARGEDLPEEEAFDSNCITPGTLFMKKLTAQLRYFINKKVSEDANWRNVEIVLSGPDVPGEGEHKIMEYIRLAKAQPDYDPNTRHCLYGLDADLIMLGLLSHDPHFALLREEVSFGRQNQKKKTLDTQNFYLMHLSLMREYLDLEFNSLRDSLSFPYDFERVLDDFVLMALFVGNDFLPNLPNLHINEGALGLVFKIYKETLPTFEGYIQDGGRVDMGRLEKILAKIAEVVEKEAFEMEAMDSLYLAGKGEDGQSERQKLHELEKKKAKQGKMVMTDKQELVFRQVSKELLKETTRKGVTLKFDMPFKPRDKKFMDKLAKDLNMVAQFDYDQDTNSTFVELSFDSDEDTMDDNESDLSELDEEAIAARDRVLRKYEDAEIIPESLTKEEIEQQEKEQLEAELKQWKADYYREKMDIDIDDEKAMSDLVGSYIVGIQWVLKYYYEGVASWGWFYPYHYAPKMSDLKNIERFADHQFTLGEPFKPFEQLMGVLPSLSRKLLPAAYQDLMTDPESPIIDFYPRQFSMDMNGKKQDWEAIVKIPFIDEKRLLEAMKSREHRLTKEEVSRSRSGPSYKYTYNKELEKMDREQLPVFPSPLPGVFPEIHHCLAREEVYQLPQLTDKIQLRKGLLPGAKMGKNALAGFPSLQTIGFTHEIKHHAVHVFQQDSRNESVLIKLKNKFLGANIEQIAKLFLHRSVYVQYPYLQEAVVIGVSDCEKKYYVSFRNGKKQILEHIWDDKEKESWESRMGRAEYLPSKRFGLLVGDIEIGFHVCTLNGMYQREEGALVKEFVNPSMEDLVPIQTVVITVANPDPRFMEKPAPPVQEAFPLKSQAFFLGSKFWGSQVTVVGHRKGNVDIEMTVPINEKYQYEPEFGHEVTRKQEVEVQYESARDVCRKLGLHPLTLSKLTSSLTVNEKSGQRINVGLNLKFDGRGEKVLGYTRKNPIGYWEYSAAAVSLIKEYCEAFPKFIQLLSTQNGGGMLSVADFGWTDDGSKALHQMKDFIKNKGINNLPRARLNDDELEEKYCKEIEKAAILYHDVYEKLDLKKVIIRGVPRKVLLKPADAQVRLNYQTFSLGDRVAYVCDTGLVPMNAKGTVVSVRDKTIDVLFDSTFMSGTDLDGKCSEFRGATLPYNTVINVSNPSKTPGKKVTTGTHNGHRQQ